MNTVYRGPHRTLWWRIVHNPLIRFRFERSRIDRRSWVFYINFGRAAGYVWGRTFYFGRNCFGHMERQEDTRRLNSLYNAVPWRIGFTQNGNAVPYTRW